MIGHAEFAPKDTYQLQNARGPLIAAFGKVVFKRNGDVEIEVAGVSFKIENEDTLPIETFTHYQTITASQDIALAGYVEALLKAEPA